MPILVDWIGYDSKTDNEIVIMCFTSVFAFLNTAVLPVLVNMDFRFYKYLSWIPTGGQYAEMNQDWFKNIAPLIRTNMILLSLMPVISLALDIALLMCRRKYDNGSCYGSEKEEIDV